MSRIFILFIYVFETRFHVAEPDHALFITDFCAPTFNVLG